MNIGAQEEEKGQLSITIVKEISETTSLTLYSEVGVQDTILFTLVATLKTNINKTVVDVYQSQDDDSSHDRHVPKLRHRLISMQISSPDGESSILIWCHELNYFSTVSQRLIAI